MGEGRFNVALYGTFIATVKLERSFDGGQNWVVCSKPDLSDASFTAPTSFIVDEPSAGVLYRLNCSAYTSGTASYRISQ
ncbi:hypothetical protein DJ018_13325 [Phenylobacterium deserti]|uniref:Uncharacterized protein n=2 Tax=Phenylobacterium deserti TaxID=1914756 RepID=A0A328ABV1_9CAUL|nr:hypothetical protein DJ018_13325 [Phenylobacterium deserti]